MTDRMTLTCWTLPLLCLPIIYCKTKPKISQICLSDHPPTEFTFYFNSNKRSPH